MSIKSRLDRLERGTKEEAAVPSICWDNLYCPLDEIQPDDSGIDWRALRTTSTGYSREACPIEARIRKAVEG
jgi:hypothetical protein